VVANNSEQEASSFGMLDLLRELCTMSDSTVLGKFDINNPKAADLSATAFWVEDLVAYYKRGNFDQKNMLANLLEAYYSTSKEKMTITGKDCSLQYLANAGIQEQQLVTSIPGLERNSEATRLTLMPGDQEDSYHFLVPPVKQTQISQWNGNSDFTYGDFNVDAKIYLNTQSMWSYVNKERESGTHDAHYLIVYLKGDGKWLLLSKNSGQWKELVYENGERLTDTWEEVQSENEKLLLTAVKRQEKLSSLHNLN
jgi:hypothetical protein